MSGKKTYSILFVDDDDFLIDMYSLKFSQAGHKIKTAQSTDAALEKLHEEGFTPDAVLFDLVMPRKDGFELLKEIKNQNLAPNAVLIVLSNQSERENIDKAKSLGATGHIIKANAIPSEVLQIVEDAVANRKG
ncbi:response regulator [bacterium]|nr:response regulator [bacterium]|tara:strand:+ start:645 stop:1043 length:399 start_codon:yes stop_codon:yes gene_type:complete